MYTITLQRDKPATLMLFSRVPVLHEVRDITLTRPIQGREQVALVSYENKVGRPLLERKT